MGTARRARLGSWSAWGIAAAAVLAMAACTSTLTSATSGHDRSAVSRPGKVITLNHITTLKTLFNRDAGHPRLILIFSPT